MKNKIVLVLLIVVTLFTITGCGKKTEEISLMDYGEYKSITGDNIKKIEIIKYTEGGAESTVVDEDSIKSVYNNLKKMKIGKETNMACDDNTTKYIFTLNDETSLTVEIECDWVIIDNNRYMIK